MQKLLSGEMRLDGFDVEWERKQIGEIGITYSGITGKNKSDFGHGTAKYITFLNVLNNPIINTKELELVDISSNENQNKAVKGDLFFNVSSETPEEVGICSVLLDDINKSGTTILMATHAKEIVDYMKKRVIAIEKGEIVRDEKRGKYEDEN